MSTAPQEFTNVGEPEPVWALATMYPPQGAWSVEDYLELTDSTNRLIEYTDGRIEVLAMPTIAHQLIAAYLFTAMNDFVKKGELGVVLFMGLRVRTSETKFREPDVVFTRNENRRAVQNRYWSGADLIMEIVSDDEGSRERDLVTKRADYAAAGIQEYWIIDPRLCKVTVLGLEGAAYQSLGEFTPGEFALSHVVEDFSLDVAATFAAANNLS